jgi:hypothetical protein
MKKLFLLLTGLLLATALCAADLTIIGGAGNFAFDTTSEETENDFNGNFYPLGKIGTTGMISDFISFSASLERDPVLRTILGGEAGVETGYLTVSAGPLFGILNSRESPLRPGFSAGLGLVFPGILFLKLRGGAILGAMEEKGDYTTEMTGLSLGFWLPHVVNTLSMTTKKFSIYKTDDLYTEDALLRFGYRLQVHEKPEPFTVAIDMGYQTLSRSYSTGGEDSLHSLFLGFETVITVRPLFAITFGAEMPLYTWGAGDPGKSGYTWLFQAFAGFIWTFEKKPEPVPLGSSVNPEAPGVSTDGEESFIP